MEFISSENNDKTREISYHFYDLDSDEDVYGGFTPAQSTLDELYPPVCHKCVKEECTLLGYFILLFIFSGGSVGLGVFVFLREITQNTNDRIFLEILTGVLGVVLATVSVFLALSSVTGCVGIFTQSKKLLRVVATFFKIVLLIEIVISSLAVYYHTRVKTETNKLAEWMSFITHYHEDPNLRFTLDSIQSTLRCCGFYGYEDWDKNTLFSCSSPRFKTCRLPVTCCGVERQNRNCEYKILRSYDNSIERLPLKFIHTRGCLAIIQDWYRYNLIVILICCVLMALVQVIIIFVINRKIEEDIEECKEAEEQEHIPMFPETIKEEQSGTHNEGVRTRLSPCVVIQEPFNIKSALIKAMLSWRVAGTNGTKEEMI